MKRLTIKAFVAASCLAGVLGWGSQKAEAFWGWHRPVTTAYSLPSVPVTAAYVPAVTVARPVVVASPIVTASPIITTGVATPATTFYAPATTAYYAPAPVTTTYYAPSTYVAPTTYAAPTTMYYAPAPYYAPASSVIVQRPILWP